MPPPPAGRPAADQRLIFLKNTQTAPAVPRRGPEAGSPRENYVYFPLFIVPV